jgi:hypothetical protein
LVEVVVEVTSFARIAAVVVVERTLEVEIAVVTVVSRVAVVVASMMEIQGCIVIVVVVIVEVASFARIVVVVGVGIALEVELAVVTVVSRVASMMDIQGCIVIVVVVVVEVSAGAGAKELAELVSTSAFAVVEQEDILVEIVWAAVVVGKAEIAETAPAALPVATIVAIVLVDSASKGSAMVAAVAGIQLDSPAWPC